MEVLLAELEPLLYGYNYQAFLRVYRVPFTPGSSVEWYVSQALGASAIVGKSVAVTGTEILADVEQSLRYAGDSGSGPEPMALRSQRFMELVSGVLSELKHAIAQARWLTQFWLQDGHPAYPVFWDFAYIIAGPTEGFVFIGSSSD